MQIFKVLSKLFPNYTKEAEQNNGRLAMVGFFILIHNYALTGWVIPGIF